MNITIHKILTKRVAIFFHPFFIIVLLFLISPPALASYQFSTKVEKAYNEFLKLKIDNGQKLINEALAEDPSNGLAILVANFGEAISLFVSEEKTAYNNLKGNEDKRLKQVMALNKNSPYNKFIQAEIKLHWAFVKLKFGEELAAALNARTAYKLLEENVKAYPDFVENKKSYGLLQIVFGSIPDKYATVVNLAGIKGDIKEGVKLLNDIAESDSHFALEGKLYKILAENYILRKDTPDLSGIKSIYSQRRDNLLIAFLYSAILMKNARSDEALTVLSNRPASSEYIPFAYLDYLSAEVFLYKADYNQAKSLYQKFLTNYKGKNLIKDTYYKLLITHWLNNEEAIARMYFPKILSNGQTVYEADKHAQKFAEKNELPNKILMKSRLYFDGGYFPLALQTIKTFDPNDAKNSKDILEFHYRKGRIYHQLNNSSEAIICYLKTIELSNNVNYYFAPNSALQMGYIYKAQNNKELARVYFNKALSYQNYEYKNSIDSKAKVALNELKNTK